MPTAAGWPCVKVTSTPNGLPSWWASSIRRSSPTIDCARPGELTMFVIGLGVASTLTVNSLGCWTDRGRRG
jgi:hypothetical protein